MEDSPKLQSREPRFLLAVRGSGQKKRKKMLEYLVRVYRDDHSQRYIELNGS